MRSPSEPTEAHKYLRELITRFPKAPSLSLAKKAYHDSPQLWSGVEACRSMVRNIRGAQGKYKRECISDKSQMVKPGKAGMKIFPGLPPAIKRLDPFQAFTIHGPGMWGIISDVHVPFHDEEAVTVALEQIKRSKPEGILLNGDIGDFYKISEHRKDPRRVDLWEEIESIREFLACLRKAFPKVRIVYKHGNHEERYINWMMVKAPELLDIPEFEFAGIFNLEKLKIEEVAEKRPIRLGKLWVLHGHEFRRGFTSPVNPARGLYMRCGENALQGDCHRSSHHGERQPLSNHTVSCFSVGCLCQLDADYDPLNKWNHGCAKARIASDGAFDVTNYRIVNGEAYS